MHFDALTLAAVADELKKTVAGGRVQQIVLPDSRSVALEIYAHRARRYLLLSAHPQASRVHLLEHKPRRGVPKETPLLLLLRKYVRSARLESVELPAPFERVLFLRFHHPQHDVTTLAVEPIGQLGNLILMNADGRILDALVRVPAGENAQRVLLPRRVYQLPPPQNRLPPYDGSVERHEETGRYPVDRDDASQAQTPLLWRSLLNRFAGVSPTLAREAAWRATGDAGAALTEQAFTDGRRALGELWSAAATGEWTPGIAVDEQEGVAAFAPYELHFCGEFVEMDSMSAAAAAFYAAQARDSSSSRDEYAGVRGGVAALVRQAQARVESQLRALDADEPAPGEPERVRAQAEWLLALSSQINYANRPGAQDGFSLQDGMAAVESAPNGQMQLVIFAADADFGQPGDKKPGEEGGDLTVPLDPKRTPVEQAERMFDRAAKMERAARIIPRRRASLEADRAYLQQLESDLGLALDQPEIVAVREALREAGYLRQRRDRREKAPRDRSRPLRYLSPEGFPILVGRNARQNELVTFSEAGRDDLWLHVRDGPGAHVVIRCGGQPVPELTLNVAARLAAWHSGQRGNGGVGVVITPRRLVTRMAGGRPGQVHYRGEETISVTAELPAESEQWLAARDH
ncbi:MAG: fibronectin-binding domain-containing protein [Caldilineaceae bacterium SB0661_bin_32]|uniref:Fibronectin-binding domain-containing protein n=1 Tax=Caldilineaceae bacterium SB0661_bin_32 TaxID=2605255 RepID=A0A6B1DA92_9CHLR|nr:fibronectin-binding domain-containing protein [Caldilineaceae bacterium SB0661_bin_32]